MKILSGDFNAKVGQEDIFKPTIGNENLHEKSNDNGVDIKLCHTQISDCQKYNVPHIVMYINLLGQPLMERLTIKLIIF
jgi:hypothetical protein